MPSPLSMELPWEGTYFSLKIPTGNPNRTLGRETFEKCSILFKVKEGENFNHRNTLKYFED